MIELKKKVLNVEYNPNGRELLTIIIKRSGCYDGSEEITRLEAVDHAHAIQSDPILLELGHTENL